MMMIIIMRGIYKALYLTLKSLGKSLSPTFFAQLPAVKILLKRLQTSHKE